MVSLNKISYVDQDFATASSQIRSFLATNYPEEYSDYAASNLGQAFIDIIGYAEQNLIWYLNRRVSDLYPVSARTPRAVSKIARMLGYKPKGASSAKVSVSLSFPKAPYTFPVQINRGFQWQGPNNTIWQYLGDIPLILQPGNTSLSNVVLSQGESNVTNFVSSGLSYQALELLAVQAGKFVERDSIVVKVDGEVWTEQAILPFLNENNYETDLLAFPPLIRFGDGVQGNVPAEGAGIEVSYVVTDGFRGRIVSQSIGEPVVGLVAQFEDIPVVVNQPNASIGGDDPEDIRSIVANAPKFQRVQDRAVTKDDYDFLANQFSGVSRADAQIVRGISGDLYLSYLLDSIRYEVASTVSGIDLSPEFSAISSAVSSMATTVSSFQSSLATSLLPSLSDADTKLSLIKTQTNASIDTNYLEAVTVKSALFTALDEIDSLSIKVVDDLQTVFDIKNVNLEQFLTAISGAVSGSSAIAANVGPQIVNIRNKVSEMRSSVVSLSNTAQSSIAVETASSRTQGNAFLSIASSVSGDIDQLVSGYHSSIHSSIQGVSGAIKLSQASLNALVSGYQKVIFDSAVSATAMIVEGSEGLSDRVNELITDLYAHCDEHLTNSCNANEVQIKVLGKDANRKYVAPLQSTLDQLKAYLSERKDIVHTVSCVAGTVDVINADILITAKVSENAVEDDVIAAIKAAIDKSDAQPFGILVERLFNKSLYIWEIDGAIRSRVTDGQIDYLNVKILGPAEYLDSDGNLVIPVGKVIQAGNITVNALPRFVS